MEFRLRLEISLISQVTKVGLAISQVDYFTI